MTTRWIKQFFGITLLTALEASRQPIFLLLTTSVIVFIALLPLLITHVVGESSRIVRDSALAVQLVSGLVLGCYAATSTITREIRRGTLASIISKPVSRWLFFIAKFSGVTLILLVFVAITTLATMLSVRTAAITFSFDWWGIGPLLIGVLLAYGLAGLQNYIFRYPFVSRAYWLLTMAIIIAFVISCFVPAHYDLTGHHHGHQLDSSDSPLSAIPWHILPAGLLIGLAMILLNSFAVSLAIRFELITTISLCISIFLLGLMSDYLFGQRTDENTLFSLIYGLLPNWQHFWAVDALNGKGIPWAYTALVAVYTAVYSMVVLLAGLASFYKMEVK